MPRVVVTGFRAFPGVADNPSQRLIEALKSERGLLPDGSACHLIDAAYSAVSPTLEAILEDPPAALVLTGFSAQAMGLRLESRAHDFCSPSHEDAFGFVPPSAGAIREYQDQLRADLHAIAAGLRQDGIDCAVSDDAGAYICNHSYYSALSRIAEYGLPTLAVFVHIPAIAGTPLAQTSAGVMELDTMMGGISSIAAALLEAR